MSSLLIEYIKKIKENELGDLKLVLLSSHETTLA